MRLQSVRRTCGTGRCRCWCWAAADISRPMPRAAGPSSPPACSIAPSPMVPVYCLLLLLRHCFFDSYVFFVLMPVFLCVCTGAYRHPRPCVLRSVLAWIFIEHSTQPCPEQEHPTVPRGTASQYFEEYRTHSEWCAAGCQRWQRRT